MSVMVEPPYLPFVGTEDAPGGDVFRWRFGLHPLDLDDWIEWGPDADAALAEKQLINASHHSDVFVALDGIDAEAGEVATELLAHLRRRWPDRYDATALDPDLHPLDAAARLVPEDLLLLVERDGRLVFGGGSVCFPNRWDLRSKLGCTMAEVHAPVPRLNDQLGASVDRFLANLPADRAYWRVTWSMIETAAWYAPPTADRVRPNVDQLHLRVERETIRRLPATNAVLFTIRTYVTPLPAVGERAALAAAVERLPTDVRGYKDLADIGDELVELLRVDMI